MDSTILQKLSALGTAGVACARAVRLDTGEERLIVPGEAVGALATAAKAAVAADKSQAVDVDGVRWFLQVFNPPIHLVIAGAVHIAQSLSRMGLDLGWRVSVIDPRTGWANETRFPGVRLDTDWPDEAMAKLGLNARSAVVTLTHDPKLDDPALAAALRSRAFYVGALGSRKSHAARQERLSSLGFGAEDIARIHGPVGLNIGALSAPEIAVSILAQIIAAARGPKI